MSEPKRKLAAIVFTDIVGFTELSAKNEPAALALLNKQRDILKPIVKEYGGDWLKEIGDGLLLTFNTNREAVLCSIAIQEAAKSVPELQLRIGIHQGEVVFQGEDVVGDDVNITSRIEPFSPVGGIAISGRVNVSLERDPEFSTSFIGNPDLKGVSQEIKIYCITSHNLSISKHLKNDSNIQSFNWNLFSITGAVLTIIGALFWINISFLGVGIANEEETPSIAILPFENKGSDQDEFYAYGISSDLISDITSSGLIRVASLGDIEKLNYNQISNSELSNKLFVRYVAKGTLWKMDSIFQLSMEIFDTELSKVVYSNRWQTNWKDLSVIKDDLSKNILESLNIDFLEKEEIEFSESDPVAYEYYLRAKHQYKKRNNTDDTEIAQGLLEKAIDLDSNLVKARLLLGDTYRDLSDYDEALKVFKNARYIAKRLGDKKKIIHSNTRIISVFWMQGELDSILSYNKDSYRIGKEMNNKYYMSKSLNKIGWAYLRKSNYDSTVIYFEQALELSKNLEDKENLAETFRSLGVAYGYLDDHEKSINYHKLALEIYEELENDDMLSWGFLMTGWQYNQEKDYENAILNFEKALEVTQELDGNNKETKANIHYNLAYSYTLKEDYTNALKSYKISAERKEDLGDKNGLAYVWMDMGYHLYFNKMDLDSALYFLSKSNKILFDVGNKHGLSRSHIQIGDFYFLMGNYNGALKNYNEALRINSEEKRFVMNTYSRLGKLCFYDENYEKALEYFEKYVDLKQEILDKNPELGSLTLISLVYKQVGKEIDVKEINRLIDKADEIGYATYFHLFKLFDDFQYLKKAHEKVQERAEKLEDRLKEKFFGYPIPKQIIDYHNSINS